MCLTTLSVTHTTEGRMTGRLMNDQLDKLLWPDLSNYPGVNQNGLRKAAEVFSEDNHCPVQT